MGVGVPLLSERLVLAVMEDDDEAWRLDWEMMGVVLVRVASIALSVLVSVLGFGPGEVVTVEDGMRRETQP